MKFGAFYREWICPIGLIVGSLLLAWVTAEFVFLSHWKSAVYGVACWLYGAVFVSDIVPFIKRVFCRTKK